MSYLTSLCETYNNFYGRGDEEMGNAGIVPVGFVEKKMAYVVYLDKKGEFHGAVKEERSVLMPSSPDAASRTGQVRPYPLYDDMRYVAGDFSEAYHENFSMYFDTYLSALRAWSKSENAPDVLSLLVTYLEKKTLFRDVCAAGAIRPEKDMSSISAAEKIKKSMVMFCIHNGVDAYDPIATIPEVRNSWSVRLLGSMSGEGLCYATGERTPITALHPKLYGNGKLISSKNTDNIFQYEGRFSSAEEACTIGYATSEKAHNTLRWLISRQGFQGYNLKAVAWNTKCYEIIQPDAYFGDEEEEIRLDTAEAYARYISATIAGYQKKQPYAPSEQIFFIALEAATNGRVSISAYEEVSGSTYLERLAKWYRRCHFRIGYYTKDKKHKLCVRTPRIAEIGEAVFGREVMKTARGDRNGEKSGTKLVRHFWLDMLSCIVNGCPVPQGYTMAAYHRVLRPQSFKNNMGTWQREIWIDNMGVALAMLNGTDTKEEYSVALNEQETDRSYLYGRLLAIADVVEEKILSETEKDRMTNAVRLFTAMQQHPASTWSTLEQKLTPYMGKLSPGLRMFYKNMIDTIYNLGGADMGSNAQLSPRYVEGYHNQRYALLHKKKKEN